MNQIAFALPLGGITFLLAVIWGGPLIRIMRMLRIGEQIRIEGPQRHFTKLGTPTMGGWLFIIPVVVITGVLNLVSLVGVQSHDPPPKLGNQAERFSLHRPRGNQSLYSLACACLPRNQGNKRLRSASLQSPIHQDFCDLIG